MARPSDFNLGIATMLIVVFAAVLLIAEPFQGGDEPPASLRLQAVEDNGRVRIDWNQSDLAAFNADSAILRVEDGGTTREYPIDTKTLKTGGLDYVRNSNDVLLSLTLMSEGKPRTEGLIRTVVAQAAPPAPEPAQRDQTRTRRRR
jgi:hypothetical protein